MKKKRSDEILPGDGGRPLSLGFRAGRDVAEERFQSLFDNASIGIYRTTPDGQILTVNPTLVRMLGYSRPEELIDRNLERGDYEPSYTRKQFSERLEREGEIRGLEAPWKRKDGCLIHVRESAWAIRGPDGAVRYYEGMVEDISRLKLAETAMSNLPGMAYRCRHDRHWTMEFVSEGCRDLTGYGASDIIENKRISYADIIHPDDREADRRQIQEATAQKRPFELTYRILTADGQEKWAWEKGRGVYSHDGTLLALEGFVTDITESRRAEEELKNSEEQFKILFECAPDGYYISDLEGHILDGNRAAEVLVGYPREELLGKSLLRVNLLPPSQVPKAAALLARNALGFPTGPDEFLLRRKDGASLPVEISAVPIKLRGRAVVLGVVRDISQHKRYEHELRVARDEAEAASHAKSEFLAGMSHELRTPLNAIIGFTQLLEDEYFGPLNAKQREYTSDILEGGNHLLSMIDEILELAKIEAGKTRLELSQFELRSFLENCLVSIKGKCLKHNIQLDVRLAGDLEGLEIEADERNLKQVFFNLLSNAAKFTPDGGWIRVEARLNGAALVFSVADSGIGIDPKHQAKVFERFYQVKSGITNKTPGTGLGLSLAKKLVELQGGKIWVESEGSGKGCRFSLEIPIRSKDGRPLQGENGRESHRR